MERLTLEGKSSSASYLSQKPTYINVEDYIRGSVKQMVDRSYRSRQSTRKKSNISRKESHMGYPTDTAKTCFGTNMNRGTEVEVEDVEDIDMPT